MKQISLVVGFIKKSIFSYILLFVLIIIAVHHILISIGYIEYKYYGIEAVKKYLYNADYFMSSGVFSTFNLNCCEEFKSKIEKYDGVKSVIYRINGNAVLTTDKDGGEDQKKVTVLMYSEGCNDFYIERLSSGEYPKNNIVGGKYQCITNLSGVNTGDSFFIFHHIPEDGEDVNLLGEIQITGKLYYGEKIINTTVQSNGLDLTDCYEYYEDIVIIPYSKEYLDSVKEYLYGTTENYYILYEDEISDEQKQYIRDEITHMGYYYADISEALERTIEKRKNTIKDIMFIPISYIYLTATAFIVVSVISAYKYMKEFSVYYMVGSTRRKIIGILNLSMVPVLLSAIIYSLILVNNYEKFEECKIDRSLDMGFVMYNSFITYIVIFLLVVLFISNIIIMAVISRMSPVKFYRQLNN